MNVHLGFEIGSGAPVEIPLKHMVVTGMTQEAGKTTALEALIARAEQRAVTFITKRGEGAFAGGRRIPPFFRERADWVFVSSLIDATLGEKNKLLRAWLMKVCRTTRTLAEVQRNVREARKTAKGFSESIYTEIEGYLDLVVPQLAQLPPHTSITIGPGLNVMDLAPYSAELQALVVRSVIEHVNDHETGVITVIPEAWEFLPEGRGNPVKREAETLIRKGAGLKNYVWIDSQDLAGVWKTIVRACPVALVGIQREANEIKRTLANIPANISKPSAADVAQLELGQFYACWGRHAVKVYVQPDWLPASHARAIADGSIGRETAAKNRWSRSKPTEEEQVNAEEAQKLQEENSTLRKENADLRRRIDALETRQTDRGGARQDLQSHGDDDYAGRRPGVRSNAAHESSVQAGTSTRSIAGTSVTQLAGATPVDNDAFYQQLLSRLVADAAKDPALLRVIASKPELQLHVERQVIEVGEDSTRGLVAKLIADGFFARGQSSAATLKELQRRGRSLSPGTLYPELDKLSEMGFFRIEDGKDDRGRARKEYHLVPGMRVNVVEA